MFSEDIEEIIINYLVNIGVDDSSLKHYRFRMVSRFWRYKIDNILFNTDGQNKVYKNKLKRNKYNDDMISIANRGCYENTKWLIKNNIIFSDIHIMMYCHQSKIQDLRHIFRNPQQLYNIHMNRSLINLDGTIITDTNPLYSTYKQITDHYNTLFKDMTRYREIYKKCGPLQMAIINGNIEIIKLLLNNGYGGNNITDKALRLGIKSKNIKVTTYLYVNELQNIIDLSLTDNIYQIINIMNLIILEFGNKAIQLLYYTINSSLKLNHVILKILYNFSNKYENNIIDNEKKIFLYGIDRILNTKDTNYIKSAFNVVGLEYIICNCIYNRNHHLCNIFIKRLIDYDYNYIIPIYEILKLMFNYYKNDSSSDPDEFGNSVNNNAYSDYSCDNDYNGYNGQERGAYFVGVGNIILYPKNKYIYSIVSILYNYVNIILEKSLSDVDKGVLNYKHYTQNCELILILVFFLGKFKYQYNIKNPYEPGNEITFHMMNYIKNDSVYESNYMYSDRYARIINDCDYNKIMTLNLTYYIKKLKSMDYRINYKECIKLSVNFNDREPLLYFVENM